jgi:5-methylcytosine-specific restriction endonuclease McrA
MTAVAAINQPVLVLNKNWAAIQVTPVHNAFALVMKGHAVIVDPETYQEHNLLTWIDVSKAREALADVVIRTPRLSLVVPEVIRLNGYGGQGERAVVFSRRNVFKRDKYTCQYCGAQPGPAELTIDHVLPKAKGGKSEWTNCVLACLRCNAKKADRTPQGAKMVLKKQPKKPNWVALSQLPKGGRKISWEQFISKAYWEVSLID